MPSISKKMLRSRLGVAFCSTRGRAFAELKTTMSPAIRAPDVFAEATTTAKSLLLIPRLDIRFDKGKIRITFQMLQSGKSAEQASNLERAQRENFFLSL